MHTKFEAQNKRCCGPEGCGSDPNFYKRLCIVSDCMAWYWVPIKVTPEYLDAIKLVAGKSGEKPPFKMAIHQVTGNMAQYGLPDKPFRGYCGHAPEAT